MILGIGMDLVEIARMARLIEGSPARAGRFLDRCFTPAERAYCDARADRTGPYAARFAAKEAAAKALGAPPGLRWRDVEVRRSGGAPELLLHGAAAAAAARLGVERAHLTLSHDAGIAAATVVLEGRAR